MKRCLLGVLLLSMGLAIDCFAAEPKKENNVTLTSFIETNYNNLHYEGTKPDLEIYRKGVIGYLNLQKQNKLSNSALLTLIDFRLSSNKKRLWVIDLKSNKVLHHSLVAHGRNTGNEYAKTFSNRLNSYSSSLGFYTTGKLYHGKHGLSLRLDGVEPGFNDNARERAIVIHSATYVNKSFAETYGRIGRSLGCPSLPVEGYEEVIRKLAGKNCLFIYYPDSNYLENSMLIDTAAAFDMLTEIDFSF